jgi:hypothetical protein
MKEVTGERSDSFAVSSRGLGAGRFDFYAGCLSFDDGLVALGLALATESTRI